jgi:phosphoserine phosphatase
MRAVLVLTAPETRGLAQADLDAARRAVPGVGDLRRLGPQAAEVDCDAPLGPFALPDLRGVDATVVPAAGRRKRILIADMDSTMIGVECIDEIADMAGIKPQVADITDRAMAGELDFEAALEARVALLAGLPETALAQVMAERIHLNPGARILVRTMAALGAETALVSGGFTWFTERVAAAAGFAQHRANTLEVADGRLTGTVARPILGRAAKRAALEQIAARIGADLSEAVALGDGANDLDMIEAAGLGVGYRPRPALAARADAVLAHSELSAVLHLQGLHADEFLRD